uniref:Putative secreted peptide n=1 Tax=Anopheles braziliensis TaxID=58242 RepID=A0A2M3ZV63_9DIPT
MIVVALVAITMVVGAINAGRGCRRGRDGLRGRYDCCIGAAAAATMLHHTAAPADTGGTTSDGSLGDSTGPSTRNHYRCLVVGMRTG